jgi:hypothetical protein
VLWVFFVKGETPLKGVPLAESIVYQISTPFVKKNIHFSIGVGVGILESNPVRPLGPCLNPFSDFQTTAFA